MEHPVWYCYGFLNWNSGLSLTCYMDVINKWHMPIWEEICRAEQKYMPIFGTVIERVFRNKIPNHRNTYKWCNAGLRIFFGKRARWWSRILDFFFQDSRIRVKIDRFLPKMTLMSPKSRNWVCPNPCAMSEVIRVRVRNLEKSCVRVFHVTN